MAIHLRSPRSARSVSLAVVMSLLATDAGAGPGDLDVTFGTGGKVITDFGPRNDGADTVAIQADGKIVIIERDTVRDEALHGEAAEALNYRN